ncbi:MAG TPA: hypothetical protein VG184_02935 [Acidimicrobiales bacterium]|jgi:hypothetical protein|nr:hypothetical protein [Acidimicrobiales bacterium]
MRAPRLGERSFGRARPTGGGKVASGCEPFGDASEKSVPVGIAGLSRLGFDEGPVPGGRFVLVFLEELEALSITIVERDRQSRSRS